MDSLTSHELLLWFDFPPNKYHPLCRIKGNVEIGEGTFIGFLSEINGVDSNVVIGDNCDIASFVAINCADSHKRCIGLSTEVERMAIAIGDNVFIGSHSFIHGGATIDNNCVVAAGTIVRKGYYPPWSLITNEGVKEGYYKDVKCPCGNKMWYAPTKNGPELACPKCDGKKFDYRYYERKS